MTAAELGNGLVYLFGVVMAAREALKRLSPERKAEASALDDKDAEIDELKLSNQCLRNQLDVRMSAESACQFERSRDRDDYDADRRMLTTDVEDARKALVKANLTIARLNGKIDRLESELAHHINKS